MFKGEKVLIDNFSYAYEVQGINFPLFKFLEPKYAKSMLEEGEVHLPCLSQFAKGSSEESLVYDEHEATFDFKDNYSYTGKGAGAPDIPGFVFGPDCNLDMRGLTVNIPNQKLPDVWIYCTTGLLLSDSLSWALNEGKKSCVMIKDPKRFRELLSQNIKNSNFSEFFLCLYDDERIATQKSDIREFYFRKPNKYASQREVRMVVEPINSRNLTISIPAIRELLLEVDISEVDPSVLKGDKPGKILHQIIKSDGKIGEFTIKEPFGIYSPVILEDRIGFASFFNTRQYKSPTVSYCDIGLMSGALPMFALNDINSIDKIKLST